ncbi:hypothetical protein HF086_016049 [Spodoptera exigua]|uniref:C2H2-type domain-containing protein n=1 Tax=Spodoptera exigua TaxID=7107 RepID=A0A922MP00_SPOEX|nr:hypothetical protein HF086_016049 [Spodoptera exigua]
MRALDNSGTLQATPQLITVPVALPGVKPGDPQPMVQIQVLSPNILQMEPKYRMQIPIQGIQQVLTVEYGNGVHLLGQGSLGEGHQVLALPQEMQLVQPTQEKDHITQNMPQVREFTGNRSWRDNTMGYRSQSSTANYEIFKINTATGILLLQQAQGLPESLQQFLQLNPSDIKQGESIEIEMKNPNTKTEEPVAEAVLSEEPMYQHNMVVSGNFASSSSDKRLHELKLQINKDVCKHSQKKVVAAIANYINYIREIRRKQSRAKSLRRFKNALPHYDGVVINLDDDEEKEGNDNIGEKVNERNSAVTSHESNNISIPINNNIAYHLSNSIPLDSFAHTREIPSVTPISYQTQIDYSSYIPNLEQNTGSGHIASMRRETGGWRNTAYLNNFCIPHNLAPGPMTHNEWFNYVSMVNHQLNSQYIANKSLDSIMTQERLDTGEATWNRQNVEGNSAEKHNSTSQRSDPVTASSYDIVRPPEEYPPITNESSEQYLFHTFQSLVESAPQNIEQPKIQQQPTNDPNNVSENENMIESGKFIRNILDFLDQNISCSSEQSEDLLGVLLSEYHSIMDQKSAFELKDKLRKIIERRSKNNSSEKITEQIEITPRTSSQEGEVAVVGEEAGSITAENASIINTKSKFQKNLVKNTTIKESVPHKITPRKDTNIDVEMKQENIHENKSVHEEFALESPNSKIILLTNIAHDNRVSQNKDHNSNELAEGQNKIMSNCDTEVNETSSVVPNESKPAAHVPTKIIKRLKYHEYVSRKEKQSATSIDITTESKTSGERNPQYVNELENTTEKETQSNPQNFKKLEACMPNITSKGSLTDPPDYLNESQTRESHISRKPGHNFELVIFGEYGYKSRRASRESDVCKPRLKLKHQLSTESGYESSPKQSVPTNNFDIATPRPSISDQTKTSINPQEKNKNIKLNQEVKVPVYDISSDDSDSDSVKYVGTMELKNNKVIISKKEINDFKTIPNIKPKTETVSTNNINFELYDKRMNTFTYEIKKESNTLKKVKQTTGTVSPNDIDNVELGKSTMRPNEIEKESNTFDKIEPISEKVFPNDIVNADRKVPTILSNKIRKESELLDTVELKTEITSSNDIDSVSSENTDGVAMFLNSIDLLDIPLPPGKPGDTNKHQSTIPAIKNEMKEPIKYNQPFTLTTWRKQASRNVKPRHSSLRIIKWYKDSDLCSIPAKYKPGSKGLENQTSHNDTVQLKRNPRNDGQRSEEFQSETKTGINASLQNTNKPDESSKCEEDQKAICSRKTVLLPKYEPYQDRRQRNTLHTGRRQSLEYPCESYSNHQPKSKALGLKIKYKDWDRIEESEARPHTDVNSIYNKEYSQQENAIFTLPNLLKESTQKVENDTKENQHPVNFGYETITSQNEPILTESVDYVPSPGYEITIDSYDVIADYVPDNTLQLEQSTLLTNPSPENTPESMATERVLNDIFDKIRDNTPNENNIYEKDECLEHSEKHIGHATDVENERVPIENEKRKNYIENKTTDNPYPKNNEVIKKVSIKNGNDQLKSNMYNKVIIKDVTKDKKHKSNEENKTVPAIDKSKKGTIFLGDYIPDPRKKSSKSNKTQNKPSSDNASNSNKKRRPTRVPQLKGIRKILKERRLNRSLGKIISRQTKRKIIEPPDHPTLQEISKNNDFDTEKRATKEKTKIEPTDVKNETENEMQSTIKSELNNTSNLLVKYVKSDQNNIKLTLKDETINITIDLNNTLSTSREQQSSNNSSLVMGLDGGKGSLTKLDPLINNSLPIINISGDEHFIIKEKFEYNENSNNPVLFLFGNNNLSQPKTHIDDYTLPIHSSLKTPNMSDGYLQVPDLFKNELSLSKPVSPERDSCFLKQESPKNGSLPTTDKSDHSLLSPDFPVNDHPVQSPDSPFNDHPVQSPDSPVNDHPVQSPDSPVNDHPVHSPDSPVNDHPVQSPHSPVNDHPVQSPNSPVNDHPVQSPDSPLNDHPVQSSDSPVNDHPVQSPDSPPNDHPVQSPDSPPNDHPVQSPDSPLNDHPVLSPDFPLNDHPAQSPDSPLNDHPAQSPDSPLNDHLVQSPDSPVNDHPVQSPDSPVNDHPVQSPDFPVDDHPVQSPDSPVDDHPVQSPDSPVDDHPVQSPDSPVNDHPVQSPDSPLNDHSSPISNSPINDQYLPVIPNTSIYDDSLPIGMRDRYKRELGIHNSLINDHSLPMPNSLQNDHSLIVKELNLPILDNFIPTPVTRNESISPKPSLSKDDSPLPNPDSFNNDPKNTDVSKENSEHVTNRLPKLKIFRVELPPASAPNKKHLRKRSLSTYKCIECPIQEDQHIENTEINNMQLNKYEQISSGAKPTKITQTSSSKINSTELDTRSTNYKVAKKRLQNNENNIEICKNKKKIKLDKKQEIKQSAHKSQMKKLGTCTCVNKCLLKISATEQLNLHGTLRIQSKKKKKYKKKPPKPAKPKSGNIVITTSTDGTSIFCCPACDMAFTEKERLETHLVGHKIERRFICGICGAGLKRKEHLERHKLGHNPERPFVCDVCRKGFKRREHLNLHTIIHSGVKTEMCTECGKGFYRKDHLRKHTRSHESKRARDEAAGADNAAVATPAPVQPAPANNNILPEITIHIPTSSNSQSPVQINIPQHVVTSLGSQAHADTLDALLAHHS